VLLLGKALQILPWLNIGVKNLFSFQQTHPSASRLRIAIRQLSYRFQKRISEVYKFLLADKNSLIFKKD
jgi:hypothetical protein